MSVAEMKLDVISKISTLEKEKTLQEILSLLNLTGNKEPVAPCNIYKQDHHQ